MNRLLRLVRSRLLLAFAGAGCIALLIWYVGPLLTVRNYSPLFSVNHRILAIAFVAIVWLVAEVWRSIKARRNNRALLDSMTEQNPLSANEEASAEETATLNRKMQEAVQILKSRSFSGKGGSRFIYELPWYAIIGPPGAGKTTLLSNSGLEFPLEESHGKLSVKGVGGTRNCDWWFTDQAVLLDTAGRYTTQDSESEVDRSAWNTFLTMLKQKRSRRPLNGVLIAISLQDLIDNDPDVLAGTAKLLRTRVEELYNVLGINPPVYLLITKCDLISGFAEFFAELDKNERRQVWGFTLPLDSVEVRENQIKSELDALSKKIYSLSISKMHRELSQRDRERIYTFPLQFALAQKRIEEFSQQLALQSPLLKDMLFRGIYLTSATQNGSVIDQVIATVSSSFGMNSSYNVSTGTSGKGYFINTLLNDVVFSESGLAGTNITTERRLKRLQIGAGALTAATLVGAIAFWTLSYQRNNSALERVASTANELQERLDAIPTDSLDIFAVEHALTTARELAYGENRDRDDEQGLLIRRAGLYQGTVIDDAAKNTYKNLLIDALLPRLMVRLEHQLHAESTNNEFVFEAIKTYQMIGNRERFESDTVTGWFNFDIDTNLPSGTSPQTRSALKQHIATLFETAPFRLPRPVDKSLIQQYQKIAATVSLEQRAYQRLKSANQSSLNSFYKISDIGGTEIANIFRRVDGVSFDQSIPNFFTRLGYNDVFFDANTNVSSTLSDDTWVLGEFASPELKELSLSDLRKSISKLYFNEYISTWEALISNVQLNPVSGLRPAANLISQLAEQSSPLKNLLVVIGEQTMLAEPAKPSADNSTEVEITDREAQLRNTLNANPQASTTPSLNSDPVTDHFSALHRSINKWQENNSQVDQVITQLSALNQQLLPMAQNQAGNADPKLGSELQIKLQQLTTTASSFPEPLSSLINNVGKEVGDAAGDGLCSLLNTAWTADVFGYYERAIKNRYPVNRSGTADIALNEFGNFFGYGGIVDQFYDKYLSTHVLQTSSQWTWVNSDTPQCVSDNTLKQFARAQDIKQTFFSSGTQQPSFQFNVEDKRLNVSPLIEELFLEIGANRMHYFNGPIQGATSFRWPDESNNMQATLRVVPVIPGGNSSESMSGPWAVLRLFDQGARNKDQGMLTVEYSFSGREVSLTLSSGSFDPLNSVALRNFRLTENL